MSAFPRPTYQQLWHDAHRSPGTSWGLFAANPGRGTLNWITPEHILAARQCIRQGEVFFLNWELTQPSPGLFHRRACKHIFWGEPTHTDDYLERFYLQGSSHWDALCHVRHPERGHYLGIALITQPAGNPIGIDQLAKAGVVGRGVLVDVARYLDSQGRGLEPVSCVAISPADFQAALAAQGTRLQEGDILLFRTGWITHWRASPAFREEMVRAPRIPGLGDAPRFAEFLWDTGIAALGSDNPTVEVFPFENAQDNLHHRLVVNLGMPLAEMLDLDALARACQADGRYEFFFSAAPLNLPGGAGSPANALAIR